MQQNASDNINTRLMSGQARNDATGQILNEHSASNILDQYGNRRPVTGGHMASQPHTVMPGYDQEGFS